MANLIWASGILLDNFKMFSSLAINSNSLISETSVMLDNFNPYGKNYLDGSGVGVGLGVEVGVPDPEYDSISRLENIGFSKYDEIPPFFLQVIPSHGFRLYDFVPSTHSAVG